MIVAISCSKGKETSNPSNAHTTSDSSLLVVAVSDYYTLDFEKAALFCYSPLYTAIDTCPLKETYDPPMDFGSMLYTTTFSNDTIFYGTVQFMGNGKILYPDSQDFIESDSLKLIPQSTQAPIHLKISEKSVFLDSNLINACIDTLKAKGLPSKFKDGKYSAYIYLFTPILGPTNFHLAKWITVLFGESK